MQEPKDKRSITTRKGDGGETSLFNGTRVSKASLRPDTYGTLDEASSFVGLARAKVRSPRIREALLKIQNYIYLVNAELACPPDSKAKLSKRFEAGHLEWVDREAAEIEAGLKLPPRFVIYGETEESAILDVARAVVRRTERVLTALEEAEAPDNPHIKPFVNRLSDLLYLLARLVENEAGCPSRHPEV